MAIDLAPQKATLDLRQFINELRATPATHAAYDEYVPFVYVSFGEVLDAFLKKHKQPDRVTATLKAFYFAGQQFKLSEQKWTDLTVASQVRDARCCQTIAPDDRAVLHYQR